MTIRDIVENRLCIGCGACAYICPDNKIVLTDFFKEGVRPQQTEDNCSGCNLCVEVCPAVQTSFPSNLNGPSEFNDPTTLKEWGPILEIWEGHAVDPAIRFKGSSGGALTAIAAYCVEVLGNHGVLHIAQNPDDPIRNRTQLSRSRQDLFAATGSRYSPASVCNGLGLVENAPAPCVIIGKPSEIAGVAKARNLKPALDKKIEVTLSFFCAESPSTAGTVALLENMSVPPAEVADLRYRGFGWPGHFAPTKKFEKEPVKKMTYRDSWAFLQAFRPWSVRLWPDGTGELADISCGDPWYEEPDGQNPGFSLVVVRSENGRRIIKGAIEAGYLKLTKAELWKLEKSQAGLLLKKGEVWGRRFGMKLFGQPTTRFSNANLFHCWSKLPTGQKMRSIFGSIRRIFTRKIYRPLKLSTEGAIPVPAPVESLSSEVRA